MTDIGNVLYFDTLKTLLSNSPELKDFCQSLTPYTSLDIMEHVEHLHSFFETKDMEIIKILLRNEDYITIRKYLSCCNIQHLVICKGCGKEKYPNYHCGIRFCEKCANIRYMKLRDKYKPILEKKKYLKFITLTMGYFHQLDKNVIKHCRDMANKLLKKYYNGGIYAFETKFRKKGDIIEYYKKGQKYNYTVKDSGVYVHLHAIVEGKYKKQQELSDEWQKISGRTIVDIRLINRSMKSFIYENGKRKEINVFNYMLKYITKLDASYPKIQLVNLSKKLYKTKFIQSFGTFYNIKDQNINDFMCQECGSMHSFYPESMDFQKIAEKLVLLSFLARKDKGS